MKVKKSRKIKSLTDHEKLINLIAVQGEKDIVSYSVQLIEFLLNYLILKNKNYPG